MPSAPAAARTARTWPPAATLLAGFAAWAIAVPWLSKAVGLKLDVSTKLEVVDHVVPGILALACAAVLTLPASRSPESLPRLAAVGVAFLAGVWITTTHVTLIPSAADGTAPWGASLLHVSAGPPIVLFGLWLLLGPPARR